MDKIKRVLPAVSQPENMLLCLSSIIKNGYALYNDVDRADLQSDLEERQDLHCLIARYFGAGNCALQRS